MYLLNALFLAFFLIVSRFLTGSILGMVAKIGYIIEDKHSK